MTTLLSRLQSATGPSRELDAEIALANHPWLRDCPRDDRDGDPGWMTKDGRTYAPRYTESIDAALTLFPSGWTAWELRSSANRTRFSADISRLTDLDAGEDWRHGNGATPAIALLIAIERVKEALREDPLPLSS